MPPTFTDEGIRAAAELRAADPDAKVLVLSQYVEERYARDLFAERSDGLGYLLKDRVVDGAEFVDALRRVGRGRLGARSRGRRDSCWPPRPPADELTRASARCSA